MLKTKGTQVNVSPMTTSSPCAGQSDDAGTSRTRLQSPLPVRRAPLGAAGRKHSGTHRSIYLSVTLSCSSFVLFHFTCGVAPFSATLAGPPRPPDAPARTHPRPPSVTDPLGRTPVGSSTWLSRPDSCKWECPSRVAIVSIWVLGRSDKKGRGRRAPSACCAPLTHHPRHGGHPVSSPCHTWVT